MENPKITKSKALMEEFAVNTGLNKKFSPNVRYLWTDAFAVCNYIGLYKLTDETEYLEQGLKLINQVHHVLGKSRSNKPVWISGLDEKTGEIHPTIGGLRIGKKLAERDLNEKYDEVLEWERDGQYYHYLIKWIHALNITAKTTEKIKYARWAGELLKTIHKAFSYLHTPDSSPRLYWKMSVDLKRPLVTSMGQHDPLDGYVTYKETETISSIFDGQKFEDEIKEIAKICSLMDLKTNDPLGIGGLLTDATIISQLMVEGAVNQPEILDNILHSALVGIKSYIGTGQQSLSTAYRLAFRELGLSIGLNGLNLIKTCIGDHQDIFTSTQKGLFKQLQNYQYISKDIEDCWTNPSNQKSMNWKEHRDINMIMLATSLYPQGFLKI